MTYSVTRVASQLMLEPHELEMIFDTFFQSAASRLTESRVFLKSGDLTSLSRSMHALKGMSLSMQMLRLGELAVQVEESDALPPDSVQKLLDQMDSELIELHQTVQAFYHP